MKNYAEGDLVRATYRGRTVKAVVILASPNGASLIIDWTKTDDGMLGAHPGRMPILRVDGEYLSLFEAEPVILADA